MRSHKIHMTAQRKFVFLLILILFLPACGTPPLPSQEPTPNVGTTQESALPANPLPTGAGDLWVGWTNGPDNPNPFLADWVESFHIFDLVYSTLYRVQPDGSYAPDLVESVEVSEDQTLWTFKIYDEVKFHDGNPLNASDVVFSLNLYGFIGDISAIDDTTFQIQLNEPIPNMEGHLLHIYILPQHIWTRYENAPDTFDNLEIIGSGPFKVEIFQINSFVHLTLAENQYKYSPKIQNIIFQVFEDDSFLAEALIAGEIDVLYSVPYDAQEILKEAPDVAVVTGVPIYPVVEELIFNQIALADCLPVEEGGLCTGHPALRDRNVRLALAHATDKDQLIQDVLLGSGTPGISMIPAGIETFFNTAIEDYAYDPARANQLLDQAGYLDSDGDGVREMVDEGESLPLRFRFYYLGPSDEDRQVADLLNEMWQQIGVTLDIEELDAETLLNTCCPSFDYDIIFWGWEVDPEPGYFLDVMDSSWISSGFNETGYSNPNYDILNAIQHSENNEQKRREIIWQLQQIAHDDVVQIALYYPQTVQAYRTDRFTGWITDALHLALEDFSSIIQIEAVK